MLTGYALLWDITQRQVVILYWRFGKTIGPIFKGQEDFMILEDETNGLYRNVGKGLSLSAE
jgi:hypothetical protein